MIRNRPCSSIGPLEEKLGRVFFVIPVVIQHFCGATFRIRTARRERPSRVASVRQDPNLAVPAARVAYLRKSQSASALARVREFIGPGIDLVTRLSVRG
jgi:hypothetical protein